MRLQTGLPSLFLLSLVLAPYVDASTKKNKEDKNGQVPILCDNSTGRGDAVTLPLLSILGSKLKLAFLAQRIHEENQASGKDMQTKRFEELINSKEQYKEVAELGKKMVHRELLKYLCQVVISLDHFKGLYEYLKQRNMVPGFLARGRMALVRKMIAEAELLETNDLGHCDSIYNAIVLSLYEDRHDRVTNLFEAARERPTRKHLFSFFVRGFFERYPPEENNMPLKRFLALRGEELGKKHPEIFGIICQRLVWKLYWQPDNIASQKLLIDLVGQPSLLTPSASAGGFSYLANDTSRVNFIKYGYKEAIEEGLKEEYDDGGRKLWNVMVRTLPNQFSGEFPSTDEARSIALKDLPTKQDREEAWAEENAPSLRVKLEEFIPGLFPPIPLTIISEYAITWISVLPNPLQVHSANVKAQTSVPGMSNKLQSGEARLDGTAAQPKAVQKVVDKVTKPLLTKRQPLEGIVDYSGLSGIDPYDDNPITKHYLRLGCTYLARNHSKKYETESVQKKQSNAYYGDCLHAVWPGNSLEALPSDEYHLKDFGSLAKGDVLTHPGKQSPFVAREDGFVLPLTMDYSGILYYHKDKPPMNLDVLSRLRWPHSKNLSSFADANIKTFSAQLRKERLNQFDAIIKLNLKGVKIITFADLKRWVQLFDLSIYDPAKLKTFREQLSLKYPGIYLSKIHRLGTRTSVEPLYNSFVPISPGATIALRYDPEVFTPPERVDTTRYSTIVTDFEHQGSKYCLVLSFDVLTE